MTQFKRFTRAGLVLVLAATVGAAHAQTVKVVYNFGSNGTKTTGPHGALAQGRDGMLYGRANDDSTDQMESAFKITTGGTITEFPNFGLPGNPLFNGGLTLGTDSYFYGTTTYGGPNSSGTIFKMSSQGVVTTLYNFTGGADGQYPYGEPVRSSMDGNFYGTTKQGGSSGNGVVYKITPSGTFSVLHTFDGAGGSGPQAALVEEIAGPTNGYTNLPGGLYGVTVGGGANNKGTVFRADRAGNFQAFSFNGSDGQAPVAPLVTNQSGNLIGTTSEGGIGGLGVMFSISLWIGQGSYYVIHNSGQYLYPGLVQGPDGQMYGITSGVGEVCGFIFRLNFFALKVPMTRLYTFPNDGSMGCHPYYGLRQHTNGLFYGTTHDGGSNGGGVLFSLDVGLAPFVTFLPRTSPVGTKVGFLGQGFAGTKAVSFNGTPASFNVVSDTYLTAIVPPGASSGYITVTTPTKTLQSDTGFLVMPKITSFSPTTGPVGTPVTITGLSLGQTNGVRFGDVKAANFTVNSDGQVTATVPSGAVTAQITVTTTGGAAYSSTGFTVTH
jgi:uncharacterized repeat protein (TIGR03803 family)